MKPLFLILALLLALPSWATISNVQVASNAACPNSTTCGITVTSTGTGHLGVIFYGNGGTTQRTISSISGGGTWTLCGSTCQKFDVTCGCMTDMAYTLNTTSGTTTITLTLSGNSNSAFASFVESSTSLSSFALNSGATPSNSLDTTSSVTALPAPSLTIAANNSVIIQGAYCGGACSAIGGSYVGTFPGGDGFAYILNQATYSAPNWTQTAGRGTTAAMAFQEAGSAGPPPGQHPVVY